MKEDKDRHIKVTVSAFIRNKEGKYFFHQSPKWKDRWLIPGGHVNFGELLMTALRREIKEETGFDINPLYLVNAIGSINPPKYYKAAHFVHMHYLCELNGGDYKPDPKEVVNGKWLTIDEALKITDGSIPISLMNIKNNKCLEIIDNE